MSLRVLVSMAAVLTLSASAPATAQAGTPARPVNSVAQAGRAIYEGTVPAFAERVRNARDAAVRLPAQQAACASCHRPSGLGSFEGGLAVPPIAGWSLFNPFDPATTHRYAWTSTLQVRPAYTAATLRTALASGRTPDGRMLSPVMPRYDFTAAEADALAAYLSELGGTLAPGVTEDTVTFATVTTPEASAGRVGELLETLERFVQSKNANTRGESSRRAAALRNEQSMYRTHRTWQLRHWGLQGPAHTWGAQLEAFYAREPVFAVLSGVGEQTWAPVHEFCSAQRVPCLLPTVSLPPEDEDFYSVYLSRGVRGQAAAAAQRIAEQQRDAAPVLVLAGDSASEVEQARAIAGALAAHGVRAQSATRWRDGATLVSALDPGRVLKLRDSTGHAAAAYLLAGMEQPRDAEAAHQIGPAWWVSEQLPGIRADAQLQRARAWLRSQGLNADSVVARNALLAATVAVESLMHADQMFSREYCIEKLEHTLENMPALTAYPRLALGPRQRFAAKQVMLIPVAQPGPGVQ